MSELRELQQRFLDYLTHTDEAIAKDIESVDEVVRARRLSIYYNAYRIRLRGSVEIDHPVLGLYLGDDLFEKMVSAYIDAYPSNQTSLRHFCDQLPAFLKLHEPFASNKVISNLAVFERLLMDVFDEAGARRLDHDFLSTLPAAQWPSLTLTFHPSLREFVTPWNSVEIWQAIKAESTPPPASEGKHKAWVVWRNRERLPEFPSLPMDEYSLLNAAKAGQSFANLCEQLLEWHGEDAVASRAFSILQEWLKRGWIVATAA